MTTSTMESVTDRLFAAGVGAMELCTVYLGVKLDLYPALATRPATVTELADRTGIAPRYLREWLQQQAIAGFLTADGDDPATARYALADGVADVLVDPTSPSHLGGLPMALAAVGSVLPQLTQAYRTG